MTSLLNRFRRGGVGTAAVIVAVGILLSRILGIVRDMIFAGLLGASEVTDVYVAAFRIPDFANYLLAGGFLTITFIPIFAKYLAEDDEAAGWSAFTAILRWLAIGVTALIGIAWVTAPSIIDALYPDFSPDQVTTTVHLTRIVLPAQFAFVVGAMFVAVQYAKGAFVVPTIAPVAYNLGIIIGGVGWAAMTGTADPAGFIWGALAGAFIGNLALQVWGARRVGMHLDLAARWRHPAVITYLTIALPLMVGQTVVGLDELFMSVFGEMAGSGSQTILQYARRTMLVPVGVIAQAAAVAAYPTLARLFAEGRDKAMHTTVDRAVRTVLILSIFGASLLAAMTVPVVRILFERGAFDADDTANVASALFMYSFGIPVWGALQVITRAFYARRQMWTPVIAGTATTIVAIPIYFLMVDAFGFEGVATTSVLALTAYTAILLAIWYRPAEDRSGLRDVLYGAGRAIPIALPSAAGAALISWAIASGISGPPLVASVIAVVAGAAAYFGIGIGIGGTLHDALNKRAERLRAQEGG